MAAFITQGSFCHASGSIILTSAVKKHQPPKQRCAMSRELLPGQGFKSRHNYLLPSCHFPLCGETKPRLLFCNSAKRSCGKQQSIVPPKILHYFPRHLTVFPFRFFLPLSEPPERAPCSDTSFWPWLRWPSGCFCLVTWSQLQKDRGRQLENPSGTR